jgi:hypothetical protein
LAIGGVVLLVIWLSGPNRALNGLFATDTPTPTTTMTPSITPPPTDTPTITPTSTETAPPTASAPFPYFVQEGDSLDAIARKLGLGDTGINLILMLNPFSETTGTGIDPTTQIVAVGQQITVPNPGMPLPSATIPSDMLADHGSSTRGIPATHLAVIASKFNSTEEAILAIEENGLTIRIRSLSGSA